MNYLRFLSYEKIIKLKKIKSYIENMPDHCIEKKAIFIHIPKAAGMSIVKSIFNVEYSNHDTWREYYRRDRLKFNQYFKFTIVRHPEDRIKSAFGYLKSGGKADIDIYWRNKYLNQYPDLNSFIEMGGLDRYGKIIEHFIPQINFIEDAFGNTMVDFIGKYERLNEDMNIVFKKINIDTKLEYVNVNKSSDSIILSDASRAIIREYYKRDFEKLGYE
tara:strand:+ start:1571 stop:2221 length:651 start_codon:yes stop_codon:yes gene_type:complete